MRHYESIDFATFKEEYINEAEGGFYPVRARIKEDNNGQFHPIVTLDMICEWRLDEGKVRFIQVAFSNDDEYQEIKKYVLQCSEYLSQSIKENVEGLDNYKKYIVSN